MSEWKRGDTAPFMRLAQEFGIDVGVVYAYAGVFHGDKRGMSWRRDDWPEAVAAVDLACKGFAPVKTRAFMYRVAKLTDEFYDRQRGLGDV